MNNPNVQDPNCEPVTVTDKQTGVKKLVYLCTAPFQRRWQFYRQHRLHFYTDMGLLATIIILLGVIGTLWFFNAFKHSNLLDFKVSYAAGELKNGAPAHFTIDYTNTSTKNLADAEVVIRFPKGLSDLKVSDSRYNSATSSISLGTIAPKKTGEITVDGTLYSDFNSTETFLFVLNYINDLGQPQQEVASQNFTVDKSVVEMSLEIPKKTVIGSTFPSKLSLNNTAGHSFENLKLKLAYPGSYSVPDDQLSVAILAANSTLYRTITTSTEGAPSANASFTANLIITINGVEHVLSSAQSQSDLERSRLIVSFVNTENNKAIKPGEQTTATLRLENNYDFEINPYDISISVSGDFTDKNFLEKTYAARLHDGALIWSSDELGAILPGERKDIQITAAALPSIFVTEKNQGPQDLNFSATMKYGVSGGQVYINPVPLRVPVASFIGLKSAAAFYAKNGDQIGVGSVPPRPGEFTAYWAILSITTGSNKLRNIKVTAQLPASAEYAEVYNVTDGAPIRLLPDDRTIEWYIDELDPYVGILGAAAEARIQIAVVPTDGDVGKILPLLTNIKLSAIDDRIGEPLAASAGDVSTIISKDASLNKVSK